MANSSRKHGHTRRGWNSPTYTSWGAMRDRCMNPKSKDWHNYGGRGITMPKRWLLFVNFLEDMGERPEGTTLGRKRNNKGYSKTNCKWEQPAEQDQNRRDNHNLKFNGETHCIAEWARILGIKSRTLLERLRHGWSVRQALGTPLLIRGEWSKLGKNGVHK